MTVTPIFLLSLPRSGSTLLQRLLATHPEVATTSEPWLLLPLLLAYRPSHLYASYRQPVLLRAFEDLLARIPEGRAVHHEAVRRFAGTFYDRLAAPGQTRFLDKTPRYHLIAEDLLDCFPDAGFVLLWRNPLAIAASCIDTWGRGRWNLHVYRVDLYHGLPVLVDAVRQHPGRLATVRYEDLVVEPEQHLGPIFDHLGLDRVPDAVTRFRQIDLEGRMGDPSGGSGRHGIDTASIDRWAATLANPVRRAWARRYLSWLGPERLACMGYDHRQLLEALHRVRPTLGRSLSDLARMLYGRRVIAREHLLHRRKRELARATGGPDVLSV